MGDLDRHHAGLMLVVERAKARFNSLKEKEMAALRAGSLPPKRKAAMERATNHALEEFKALEHAANAFALALDELQRLRGATTPQPEDENPFKAFTYMSDNGLVQTFYRAADDRLRVVPTFDAAQCASALLVPGLQIVVRKAIERRQLALMRGTAP